MEKIAELLPNQSKGNKKNLEELKKLSKEELLKVVFDKDVSKIKEGGHAKYAMP